MIVLDCVSSGSQLRIRAAGGLGMQLCRAVSQ